MSQIRQWLPDGPHRILFVVIFVIVSAFLQPGRAAFPLYTTWYINTQFHPATKLFAGILVGLLLAMTFRSLSGRKDETAERFDLSLLAGPREEPYFNWLLLFSVASILKVINLLTHDGLDHLAARFPVIGFPEIAIADEGIIILAMIIVSTYFAHRHTSKGNLYERIIIFILRFILGLGFAVINFTQGIVVAMVLHSFYDLWLWFLGKIEIRLSKLWQR